MTEKVPNESDMLPEVGPKEAIIITAREQTQATTTGEKINPFKGEVLRAPEISPELIRKVSDFYRWIFGNTMHFAVCVPCEDQGKKARWTAPQIFQTKNFVSTEQMDNTALGHCPCCGQKSLRHFYDPAVLRNNFEQKLKKSDDSFLSLVRSPQDGIVSLAFAYITELERELFLEWGHKYMFMQKGPELEKPEYHRSFEHFQHALTPVFPDYPLEKNSTLLAWNCMTNAPDAKGSLPLLMRNLFNSIPIERHALMVLGDVKKGSDAHRHFKVMQGRDVTTFFGEGDTDILIGGNVGIVIKAVNYSNEQYRAQRQPKG